MQISDVVAGRAGLAGVRWVLLGAHVRRGLRDVLRTALPAPNVLGPCRLRRAKLKPARKLSAWYDAYVRVPGVAQACRRPLAVTWTPPAAGPAPDGMLEVACAQAAAVRQGLAAPFERLWGELPAWGMHIRMFPLDEKFAQLVRVSDPQHVREMLAAVGAATAGRPASR